MQVLELFEDSRVIATYPISTSARGAGERVDSEQTPRGLHEVRDIGDGAPAHAVFVGQRRRVRYSRQTCKLQTRTQAILSRVIRLGGPEDGKNRGGEVDTFRETSTSTARQTVKRSVNLLSWLHPNAER